METKHANIRMQQRGVPPIVIQWLQAFGEKQYDHQGGIIVHFSKRTKRKLEQTVGREPVHRMHEWLRAYIVTTTDGILITAGLRYQRIKIQ